MTHDGSVIPKKDMDIEEYGAHLRELLQSPKGQKQLEIIRQRSIAVKKKFQDAAKVDLELLQKPMDF